MEVTSTRAANNLGELLELVRSDGTTVTITRYGRLVAVLKPPTEAEMNQGGENPPATPVAAPAGATA